jgi:hypothetical protein
MFLSIPPVRHPQYDTPQHALQPTHPVAKCNEAARWTQPHTSRECAPSFFFMFAYFSGGVKAGILRLFVPADGRAIVEREWIDDWGNPSLYRIVTWVGQPPLGV